MNFVMLCIAAMVAQQFSVGSLAVPSISLIVAGRTATPALSPMPLVPRLVVRAQKQYLERKPIVIAVRAENRSKQAMLLFEPSVKIGKLMVRVKRDGEETFLKRTQFRSYFVPSINKKTLKPGKSLSGSIDVNDQFRGGLPIGKYVCEITYVYGAGADERLRTWSKLAVVPAHGNVR